MISRFSRPKGSSAYRIRIKQLVWDICEQAARWAGDPIEPQAYQAIELSPPDLWHEAFIEHLSILLRPKVYVELGLYKCRVFNRVIPYAEHLVGVDTDCDVVKLMALSEKTKFVNSTTEDFVQKLTTDPIAVDMLFIDADHAKDSVLRDFFGILPFVSQHGLILLHDTHPKSVDYLDPQYCNDAYKAIEELSKRMDQFEMMTIPLHPGLTLCRKRTSQLSWLEQPT